MVLDQTNLSSSISCYDKVDKDRLSNNDLVKGQFKADNQYQIVIGPGTVDEVYKQFVEVTGTTEASKEDAKSAAAKKGNPVQRLIKLLGDIFIPILPAIVTAGLLMGINNLLTMKGLFGPKPLVEQFPHAEIVQLMVLDQTNPSSSISCLFPLTNLQ